MRVFILVLLKKLMWTVEVHVYKLFCLGQPGWLYFLRCMTLGREAGVTNLSFFFFYKLNPLQICVGK